MAFPTPLSHGTIDYKRTSVGNRAALPEEDIDMNAERIRSWRPSRFSDIVGAENRRTIRRLQKGLLEGSLASPMLVVSPFGYSKTSLVRLVLLALNCRQRDPATADPCLKCDQCQCSGRDYCGFGYPFRRVEVDCAHLDRRELVDLCRELLFDRDVALFLDEIHHLEATYSQEALLKFVEDFPGRFICAVMQDRLHEVIPPLRERMQMIWLVPPTEEEMVEFFLRKCSAEWQLEAPERLVRLMVERSNRSFRICQRVLGAAAENDGRGLDGDTLDEFLT
jgi:DNA polymerase III gamma/tau subunit